MNEIKRPRIIHYTGEDPETFSIACADALVITESGLIYSNGNPVGGLSKEDISALIEGNHTYSIDFGTDVTTVTDINMFGDITLTEIKGYNATAISYYIQNSIYRSYQFYKLLLNLSTYHSIFHKMLQGNVRRHSVRVLVFRSLGNCICLSFRVGRKPSLFDSLLLFKNFEYAPEA